MIKHAILVLCLVLLPQRADAQRDDVTASRAAYRQAVTAYQAGEYEAFLEHMREAARLRPQHPGLLYNVAAGHALTGANDKALRTLRRYAAMGVVCAPQDDADFAGLLDDPAFETVREQLDANGQPVVRSTEAFQLDDDHFVPEGIAYDPATKAFFVGSVHQQRIVRVDAAGTSTDFATARDGLWSVLGIAVDAERRRLWVCTSARKQTRDLSEEQHGQTGLLLFDLDSGQQQRVVSLTADSSAHAFGDLTLNAVGDVFVTDGAESLEELVPPQTLLSPQGLCFAHSGNTLYLADYSLGLLRLDAQTGALKRLQTPANVTLLGIDGLACHGDTLLAIQNGVRPHRVLRIRLAATGDAVEHVETLEANHPAYQEPTLGTVVGDELFYVANSQWNRFDENGRLPEEGLQAPVILRLPLAE